MTTPEFLTIAVLGTGSALLALFLILRLRMPRARLNYGGLQELEILVKGRYIPDVIEVRRSIPVRLNFRREEDTPCSERVIFSDFHVGAFLPAHQTTPVYFVPTKLGEFLFTCAFGMYQGRLVVVEPPGRDLARIRENEAQDRKDGLPHLAARGRTSVGFVPKEPDSSGRGS